MKDFENPFEYDAALNLPEEMILAVYVEDYNYTRFIQSTKNVFLHGERGSGKSMTLIYNSFNLRRLKALNEGKEIDFSLIGIYIPCNTSLTHNQNYLLLTDAFQSKIISEHFLSLQIVSSFAESLSIEPSLLNGVNQEELIEDLSYILSADLPKDRTLFDALRLYTHREAKLSQEQLQSEEDDLFYRNACTFSSLAKPTISLLRKIPRLSKTHFLLMFDDAHYLNLHQRRTLNSWIAFRDHALYSFKVAAVKTPDWDYLTHNEGNIVEGHDFIVLDLEESYQSRASDFGKLSREILHRRLQLAKIKSSVEEFFPVNPSFEKGIKSAEEEVRQEAMKKFPKKNSKQINDYVYRYGRAEYFRGRDPKANLPPYSGLETIVHMSTGVIRNLLDPCFWMYDSVLSEYQPKGEDVSEISHIPPPIQTEVIRERSEELWTRLQEGLDKSIESCSREQGKQIFKLFNNLGVLFRDRLLHHKSEPRVLSFSISGMTDELHAVILPLLDVARRAQMLYVRLGPAKDKGKREFYYVPNRMLWPIRGLDVYGQHGRVSLKAADIWNAAQGTPFPFSPEVTDTQEDLFNE